MITALTSQQESDRLAFREFVEKEIRPHADQFDREEAVPASLIRRLAERGYLGAALPSECGGWNQDAITYGLLHEEIGRGCSSVRSLLTVHDMVGHAILRWGTTQQREFWLPRLSGGQVVAAFGLSEPNAGSDAARIETSATLAGDSYILNGEKKWVTFGQLASLFLIFALCEGQPSAFLVERDNPGLSAKQIGGLLGVRASMLAHLRLDGCRVSRESVVGKVGFGFSHVAASALDQGRYSVAWGCVGLAQACLEACLQYTARRKQFGSLLKDHQLIRRMISDMITNLAAARLLCLQAARLRSTGHPEAIPATSIAKYFASRAANQAARDAVQIHGASGCCNDHPVARYFRDAKIMEIIEGSNEIQQLTIAEYGYRDLL